MKTRRALLAIAPLVVIVVLGVIVKQVGPQRVELGKFKTEDEAQQAAFIKLSQVLRQHPYANIIEINWRGPMWSPDQADALNKMKYSRIRENLFWRIGKVGSDGIPYYLKCLCVSLSAADVQRFVNSGAKQGSCPSGCVQNIIQFVYD